MFYLQIYDAPENSRPKKWSSKLKLNTSGSSKSSEKSPESPYMYGTVSGQDGSALSKSMKYAETWLYGSVRTQTPTVRPSVFSTYSEVSGPVLISTPQKPTPHNYAVILCSCPEYLNGTKKTNSTKVSICKKCKGSRLPLTIAESPRMLVGGTVRGPQVSRDGGLLRAGTVRVQGTKARPTILKASGDTDPYDLMRRSRLAPPHETRIGSQFSTTRSRAKSISPCRIKTKQPSPETLNKSRSKSVSRVNDLWIEEEVSTVDKKKSILSCDINPYDLVKTGGSDDYSDVFQESHKLNDHLAKRSKSDTCVKAIGGQRIRISNELKPSNVDDESVYDPVNFDLKNYDFKSTDMSSALSLPNIKNESKFASLSKNTSKKIMNIPPNRTKQKSVSPKRPPRRSRNHKTDDDSESDNQRLSDKSFTKKSSADSSRSPKYKNRNNDPIKSILKKPRNYELNNTNVKIDGSEDSYENKRTNSSQFYIPKPKDKTMISPQNIYQRKRVKFLVENEETKVIYTADLNLHDNVMNGNDNSNVILEVTTEDEIVAEGDIVSHSLEIDDIVKPLENPATNVHNDSGIYEDVQMNTNIVSETKESTSQDISPCDIKNEVNKVADNAAGTFIFSHIM